MKLATLQDLSNPAKLQALLAAGETVELYADGKKIADFTPTILPISEKPNEYWRNVNIQARLARIWGDVTMTEEEANRLLTHQRADRRFTAE